MDINKEFDQWLEGPGDAVVELHLRDNPGMYDEEQAMLKAYIAAATPRDLLIEQLVGALKTCHYDQKSAWFNADKVSAALSAAKERGYGG